MLRRMTAVAALAVGLVVVPAVGALAHECFVANRSEEGTRGSGNSQRWFVIDIEEALIAELGLTEAQAAAVVAEMEDRDLPTTVSIFGGPTLMEHLAGEKSGDGKGIEHFFTGPYFGQIVEIMIELGIPLPEFGE